MQCRNIQLYVRILRNVVGEWFIVTKNWMTYRHWHVTSVYYNNNNCNNKNSNNNNNSNNCNNKNNINNNRNNLKKIKIIITKIKI